MEVLIVAAIVYLLIGFFVADQAIMFPVGRWTIVLYVAVMVLWLPLAIGVLVRDGLRRDR